MVKRCFPLFPSKIRKRPKTFPAILSVDQVVDFWNALSSAQLKGSDPHQSAAA